MKKREIYISEAQYEALKKYQLSEKKEKISAQSQVGGKVNAGIMDAITGCGMMEEDENNPLTVWYCSRNDDNENFTWLYDNPRNADADEKNLIKIVINSNKISPINHGFASKYIKDLEAGPTNEEIISLKQKGYDCCIFFSKEEKCEKMCFWGDKSVFSIKPYIEYDVINEEESKESFDFDSDDEFVNKICKIIPHTKSNNGKYVDGVLRIVYQDNLPKRRFSELDDILKKITSGLKLYSKVIDGNLNDLSIDDLNVLLGTNTWKPQITGDTDKIREVKNGYSIIRADNEDEFKLVGITELPKHFKKTKFNTIYLVVNSEKANNAEVYCYEHEDEWNREKNKYLEEAEDKCVDEERTLDSGKIPYDDYGLSIFVVLISEHDYHIYSRYDIENGDNDEFLSKDELSKLLGDSFENLFPLIKTELNESNEPDNSNIEVWYRGFNSQHPNMGVPDGQGIWITDSIEYAKEYAEQFGEYGKVAKVYVDFSKVNYITEGDVYDNNLDAYYAGTNTVRTIKDMGYNAWLCHYDNDDCDGICLVDSTPIVKTEVLSDEEYNQIGISEGAEPESDTYSIGFEGNSNNEYGHVLQEEKSPSNDIDMNIYDEAMKSIADFMEKEGLKVHPLPSIELNWDEQDGLFIRTGYYAPGEKKVVLFCNGRHVKDILRSYAHEMIHHAQNLEGKNLSFTSNDDVKDNKELEKLEAEAYLKGNILFRKWTEYVQHENKKDMLNENVEYEEVNPDDVDLSSFNIKKHLNPKFWKDGRLDSRIRMKLLDLADDFIEYLGVDWVKPDDIIITGSIANFNWNQEFSDIDLHVVLDYSKVDEKTEFVTNYFNSLKKNWNEEHKGLKIYGFPVEVYVQDSKETHTSTGVYSLEKDTWIETPERDVLATSKVDKKYIKKKVARFMDKIDNLETIYKEAGDDDYKIRKVYDIAKEYFDEIKAIRKKDLAETGKEISNGNIIFKTLRRINYIEKLLKIRANCYNKINSLP